VHEQIRLHISMSMGVAVYPTDGLTIDLKDMFCGLANNFTTD
jgi:hypothetical protein